MKAIEAVGGTKPVGEESLGWLQHWHWLIPADFRVICVTRLGDAFLRDPHDSVWWLDAGAGLLELVGDQKVWETRLATSRQCDLWSGRALVQRLEASGLVLAPGQCYTYLTSPIMGGSYEPSNFKMVSLQTHFDIWGPLLMMVKDLPDGTKVTSKVMP